MNIMNGVELIGTEHSGIKAVILVGFILIIIGLIVSTLTFVSIEEIWMGVISFIIAIFCIVWLNIIGFDHDVQVVTVADHITYQEISDIADIVSVEDNVWKIKLK